jgi:hypothetical protein
LTILRGGGILSLTFAGEVANVQLSWLRRIVNECAAGAIALFPLLVLSDCTPSASPMAKLHGVPASGFEQQLNQACGQPIAYPLSSQCIALMGSAGPMLEHRSELVMAIWRTCPYDNPCYRIATTDPACTGQGLTAVTASGVGDPCQRAQQANYSCAALRDDLAYMESVRQPAAQQDVDNGCEANKKRLEEYDNKIEEMSVRIQWYRIFAKKKF